MLYQRLQLGRVELQRTYLQQLLTGTFEVNGASWPIEKGSVSGDTITFVLVGAAAAVARHEVDGQHRPGPQQDRGPTARGAVDPAGDGHVAQGVAHDLQFGVGRAEVRTAAAGAARIRNGTRARNREGR